MSKKFQVFVSSTYQDLIDERQDAIRSVLDLGHIPSGMEAFHAADFEQFTYIKKIIDECDYYVLIIGGRYGSTDENGISYTELEYDYAVKTGKIVLAFLHGDPSQIPSIKCDNDEFSTLKLKNFREKVSGRRLVSFWSTRHDLKATVIISLSKAFSDLPGTGWMRADMAASEEILTQINQLRTENEKLKTEISASRPVAAIENLAGLNDVFEFKYNSKSSYNSTYSTRTLRKTWEELLSIIGPNFFTLKWSHEIKTTLEDYLERACGHHTARIDQEIINRIRIQFDLLRVMQFSTASSSKGGSNEAAVVTDLGRAVISEALAVRKMSTDAS